jgi:hypothetical protein
MLNNIFGKGGISLPQELSGSANLRALSRSVMRGGNFYLRSP